MKQRRDGGFGESGAALFMSAGTFAREFPWRSCLWTSFLSRSCPSRNFPSTNYLSTELSDLGLSSFFSFDEESPLPDEPWRRGFLGVVGDVPAGAFELDGGSGDHLLDLAAAFGALLNHLVGELLDFFEAVTALLAFVFVKRHECETVVRDNSVSY